jgi:hypothetical protein
MRTFETILIILFGLRYIWGGLGYMFAVETTYAPKHYQHK